MLRQTEQARAQAKLEDRLRRLEGRLQLVDAQLAVLRAQGHDARQAKATPGPRLPGPQEPRVLRLGEPTYDGDTRELTWPRGQQIVTDASGRVRLMAATEAPAEGAAPDPARVQGTHRRRTVRPPTP